MTLASQLLGAEETLYLAIDDPDGFDRLIAFSTAVVIRFGIAQIEAGAHLPMSIRSVRFHRPLSPIPCSGNLNSLVSRGLFKPLKRRGSRKLASRIRRAGAQRYHFIPKPGSISPISITASARSTRRAGSRIHAWTGI